MINIVSDVPRFNSYRLVKSSLPSFSHASWEPHLNQVRSSFIKRQELLSKLHQLIAELVVLERPNRREPRVLKRRPKNYQLMMVPRGMMMEVPHRGRKLVKQA